VLFVVALYRHGVRAPLNDPNDAENHARGTWPSLGAWGAATWGDLTSHGKELMTSLGGFYASRYGRGRGADYRVFLWSDVDRRTVDTAQGLADGFRSAGNRVTVSSLPVDLTLAGAKSETKDPLFHPFAASCGNPDPVMLGAIATDINQQWRSWVDKSWADFNRLWVALDCYPDSKNCSPLSNVTDFARAWSSGSRGSSPIVWAGKSATRS
jgi:hypothetical protein